MPRDGSMKRPATSWAAVHCPALPLIAVWRLVLTNEAIAVHAIQRGQTRIVQANRLARQRGVRPHQRLSEALAIVPSLESRPQCRRAEQQALETIALTAYQHSHQVVLAPADSVLLEIAGSRRLHGSTTILLKQLHDQLTQQGFRVRLGQAPTPAAARLLARRGRRVVTLSDLDHALNELALSDLDLDQTLTRQLNGCGLRCVGELMRLPCDTRARRFGTGLNGYLDELYGRVDTPLAGWHPAESFALKLELPVATTDAQALLFVLNRALAQLETWLELRARALTNLRVCLRREDGGQPSRFVVGLSRPGFDRDRLLDLLALKLETLHLPGAIDGVLIRADSTTEHQPAQADLIDGHNRGDAWSALIDRLTTRLGPQGLGGLAAWPDHRPEKAWRWVAPGSPSIRPATPPRPNWLLNTPRPCQADQLRLEEGPERIETGWWDGQDCRRDYWVARDQQQRKLWVFHEQKPRTGWFIHGIFG